MLEIKLFLRFFEKDFIVKLLFLMLLYSILPLGEIVLLLKLGGIIGNYLTLALAAFTGLFGVLIALSELRRTLNMIRLQVRDGVYPGEGFVSIFGILAGGIFLLTPGFITDFIGFLLFIPAVRIRVGRVLTKKMNAKFKELYEYLKLYDV